MTIALAVLPPLTAPLERRFLRCKPSTGRKLAYYAFTATCLWSFAAAALWISGLEQLRSADWPLPLPSVTRPLGGALLAAYFLLGLMPLLQSLRGPRWRRAYAEAYRRHSEGFSGLLPETVAERVGFVLLSVTAGICEETLYRGFLIRYLHDLAPALPLLLALAAAALLFGLAHLYQGRGALLRTAITGLAFGGLFVVTGSLLPCIVLHALIDLQGVYVLRPFPEDARPQTE